MTTPPAGRAAGNGHVCPEFGTFSEAAKKGQNGSKCGLELDGAAVGATMEPLSWGCVESMAWTTGTGAFRQAMRRQNAAGEKQGRVNRSS